MLERVAEVLERVAEVLERVADVADVVVLSVVAVLERLVDGAANEAVMIDSDTMLLLAG